MSWEDEMAEANKQRQSSSTSDFYKFPVGEHVMRIMTKPVRKESRYGYGICYPGASYCDPAKIEEEMQEKMKAYDEECAKVKAKGGDVKKVKKPSRPNIGLKWSVWALVRGFKNEKGVVEQINELKIVDLPHGVSESLLALKMDKDMGTNFDEFPMPYDVKITVKKKDTKGRAWTPKDIEYSLTAGQKRSDIAQDDLDELEKKTPVQQIIERMQEKKREDDEGNGGAQEESGGIDYPKDDINPDDIPF